jgi:hypothetical protein
MIYTSFKLLQPFFWKKNTAQDFFHSGQVDLRHLTTGARGPHGRPAWPGAGQLSHGEQRAGRLSGSGVSEYGGSIPQPGRKRAARRCWGKLRGGQGGAERRRKAMAMAARSVSARGEKQGRGRACTRERGEDRGERRAAGASLSPRWGRAVAFIAAADRATATAPPSSFQLHEEDKVGILQKSP